MESKFIKKLIVFVSVFVPFSFYCYSQPSYSEQQECTETNTSDLWSGIELNLKLLEQEQNNMKKFAEKQERQITNLENAYNAQVQLYQNLENKYMKSEENMKKWKACSIVLGTTTITLGITTSIFLILLLTK